ncbi:hypothetical protein VNO78_13088 [Psophocarpus tetragonolobus]|uniref:Germin-like protein n=1 Tax=Psophocarpus tetragonolobus TaxID=3891 RepID=A0AAN9SQR8_PSOTE
MANITLMIIFFLALISSSSFASNVNDFCVADLKGPYSPSGYQCLPPNTLKVDNFVFNLQIPNISNHVLKAGINTVTVNNFPALNGLDLSVVRVAIDKDGFFPIHIHKDATELIIALEGEITAGFITGTNAYVKTLKPGDLMVIPQGLFHFVANTGNGKSSGYGVFSSSNPSVQAFNDIFANNVPSNVIAQTTFLDVAHVKKLKALFGGSS